MSFSPLPLFHGQNPPFKGMVLEMMPVTFDQCNICSIAILFYISLAQ
jgi:hypothetical protein